MTKKRVYFSQCRKAMGTQKKVAQDNNVSEVYIRLIECGTFTPGRDLMFRLSQYFGEPAEKLFPDYFESNVPVRFVQTDN